LADSYGVAGPLGSKTGHFRGPLAPAFPGDRRNVQLDDPG
jgi:hypothetical protein